MNTMKWMAMTVLMLATQFVNAGDFAGLKNAYTNANAKITADAQKQKDSALEQYGKGLGVLLLARKQKGDLDSYMVLEQELKRFRAEEVVISNDVGVLVADLVEAYQKQVAAAKLDGEKKQVELLKRYVGALGVLLKDLMVQDKMVEAKLVSEEKKGMDFLLADMVVGMPVEVKTNVEVKVVKVVKPVEKKSVVGKWRLWTPNGTPDPRGEKVVFSNNGKYEVRDSKNEYSGTYVFTNLEKTKMTITCNNGQIVTAVYNEDTGIIMQNDGWSYHRFVETTEK